MLLRFSEEEKLAEFGDLTSGYASTKDLIQLSAEGQDSLGRSLLRKKLHSRLGTYNKFQHSIQALNRQGEMF